MVTPKTSKKIAITLVDIGDILDINSIPYRGITKNNIISMESENLSPLEEKKAVRCFII